MLPQKITIPAKVVAGATVVRATGPKVIKIDRTQRRNVFKAEKDGKLRKMPAAEGSITLLLAGVLVPEPMTLCVTIFDMSDGRRIFVCTELAENRGVSVTNAWPDLAGILLKGAGGVSHEKAVFVEHYFPGSYRGEKRAETMDMVEITWKEGRPVGQKWVRL